MAKALDHHGFGSPRSHSESQSALQGQPQPVASAEDEAAAAAAGGQRTPLLRFAHFLIQCLRRGKPALQLVQQLRRRYEWSLSRDAALDPYVDAALAEFCGYKPASGNPLGDLLQSMLGGGGAQDGEDE